MIRFLFLFLLVIASCFGDSASATWNSGQSFTLSQEYNGGTLYGAGSGTVTFSYSYSLPPGAIFDSVSYAGGGLPQTVTDSRNSFSCYGGTSTDTDTVPGQVTFYAELTFIWMGQPAYCTVEFTPPSWVSVNYHMPNSAPTTIGISGIQAHLNIGVPVSLTATLRDVDGYSQISSAYLLIRDEVNWTNACALLLYPGSNTIQLLNPAGNDWGSAITMGSGSLDNGWCHVNGAGSSYGTSGSTDRTVTVSLYFKPPMLAYTSLNHYLYANDASTNSGWSSSYGTTALHSGPKIILTEVN